MYLKQPKVRDRKYLDSARDRACLICGIRGDVVFHHLRLSDKAGTGTKACDDEVLNLCHRHHLEIHQNEKDFLKRYEWVVGSDPIAFAKLLYKRYLTNSI